MSCTCFEAEGKFYEDGCIYSHGTARFACISIYSHGTARFACISTSNLVGRRVYSILIYLLTRLLITFHINIYVIPYLYVQSSS